MLNDTKRSDNEDMPISSNIHEENEGNKIKHLDRIVAVDFGRGFGLFIVLLVHALHYWAFDNLPSNPNSVDAQHNIFLLILFMPFIILGSWASIFALLTGASTVYIIYYQVSVKNMDMGKKLLQSLISAIILMGIHFFYVYFLIYPTF
ncbi:MAG: hypothetical protein ACTSXF_03150, partial [Promethearchaeota archaeon]